MRCRMSESKRVLTTIWSHNSFDRTSATCEPFIIRPCSVGRMLALASALAEDAGAGAEHVVGVVPVLLADE